MKRLSYILIFLFVSVGFTLWAAQNYSIRWEPRLKKALEDKVAESLKLKLELSRIRLAYLYRIDVENVRLWKPTTPPELVFQAPRLSLKISWLDLPRAMVRRNLADALGVIHLQDPWVSLSPALFQTLPRLEHKSSSFLSGPLFFSVTWENGSVRWTDVTRSSAPLEIAQMAGIYKIRGPKIDFALKGKPTSAEMIRLDYGKLGKRWNARLVLRDAAIGETLHLAKPWISNWKNMDAASWSGRATFEMQAGGRGAITSDVQWGHILRDSHITFNDAQWLTRGKPLATLAGRLHFKDRHLELSGMTLRIGAETLKLKGEMRPFETPLKMDLSATGPTVTATVHARHQNETWHFDEKNALHWGMGHFRWQGTWSEKASDLRVTLEDLSVQRLSEWVRLPGIKGRLNASGTWKGPKTHRIGLGSFWVKDLILEDTSAGNIQGDFNMTPGQFHAQATAGDPRFHFFLQGTHRAGDFRLTSVEMRLPSGGLWSGQYSRQGISGAMTGSLRGQNLYLPDDMPLIKRWFPTKIPSPTAIKMQWSGTIEKPIFKGSLQSSDNSLFASWVLQNQRLQLDTPWLKADVTGEFPDKSFALQGTVSAVKGRNAWEIPLTLKGTLPQAGKPGTLHIQAPTIWLKNRKTAPFDAYAQWEKGGLQWTNARWGKELFSEGRIQKNAEGQLQLQGQVRATRLSLSEWFSVQGPVISGVADLSGSLEEPRVVIEASAFGGTLRFTGGYQKQKQALFGSASLSKLSLEPIGKILRLPKPLEGTTQGTLTVSGPLKELQYTGHLEGGAVSYGGKDRPIRIHDFSMDMTVPAAKLGPNGSRIWELRLAEAQVRTEEETIRFQNGSFVEFAPSGQSRLSMRMEIRNLQIGLARLFGGLDLDGTWEAKEAGFAIQGLARTRSLFINDYELQEGEIRADYYDRILRFIPPEKGSTLMSGSVDFRQIPQLHFDQFRIAGKQGQGLILDGDLGPDKWDFNMAGQKIDLGVLAGLAEFPYPLSGVANASIRGSGDLKHPHAEGTLDVQNGRALGLSFDTGSAQFIWRNNRLSLQKLLLSVPGRYTLMGSGGFPLQSQPMVPARARTDSNIDFTARLEDSNLGLVQSIVPSIRDARGPVEGILQITGNSAAPQLRGQVKVKNGSMSNTHYFRKLDNIQLTADFKGTELVLHELRGTSGGGEVRVSGRIGFAGFLPSSYDLSGDISPNGVEIQVPELAISESPLSKRLHFLTSNSYGNVRGQVTFKGPAESPQFKAQATVTKGHFTFPPSKRGESNPAVLEWFNRVQWDVDLRFQDNAWFENDYLAASVLGNIRLRGPNDHLRSDGSLDVTEGRVNYLGIQFDIRQAHLDLRSTQSENGTVSNVAYLRGTADSHVQQSIDTQGSLVDPNDTITLTVDYAPLSAIKPRLTSLSNPNLSQEKLLARVGNLDVEKLTPQERTQLYQQQMVRAIDASLTTPLARKILRPIGLNIRSERVIDPNTSALPTSGTSESPLPNKDPQQNTGINLLANSKYTIETMLNNRFSLGYGVRFVPGTDAQLQNRLDLINDLQLSYRLFRGFYLKGSYELPNANNPNFVPDRKTTIEKQWRFPWTGFHKKKPKSSTTP